MVCDLPTRKQRPTGRALPRHIAPAIRCTVPVATPRNSESVALWQLLSSRCWPTLVRHRARQRENKVAGNDDKRPVSAPPPAYAQHKVTMDFSTQARIRPMHLRRSAKAGRTSNQPIGVVRRRAIQARRLGRAYGDGGDGGGGHASILLPAKWICQLSLHPLAQTYAQRWSAHARIPSPCRDEVASVLDLQRPRLRGRWREWVE